MTASGPPLVCPHAEKAVKRRRECCWTTDPRWCAMSHRPFLRSLALVAIVLVMAGAAVGQQPALMLEAVTFLGR
jgi:hypothetical protein